MVVVATLDTRGNGSTTVCAITSVTLGGFSPERERDGGHERERERT